MSAQAFADKGVLDLPHLRGEGGCMFGTTYVPDPVNTILIAFSAFSLVLVGWVQRAHTLAPEGSAS